MNRKIITLAILITLIFMYGCEEIPIADDTGATTEGVASVVNANNQFTFELYSEIKDEGNVFFSPYSISTALAMTYEGARGQTAQEMQEVLHFPEDANIRRPAFAKIYNLINKPRTKYKLHTANALWAQKNYQFLNEYFGIIQQYYIGKVTNLDFVLETEKSRKTINDWVEEKTNNKIKDLIPQGALNQMTRLVLTNAIYFKGNWVQQFDKKDTIEEDFRISPGNTVKVPMMRLTGEEFNYTETDELQVLEMTYAGEELSMLVLLPKQDLESIELDAGKLAELRSRLREQQVDVYMPRFTFETKYFLTNILKEMGMPTAFSMDADLSGMDGTKNLFITDVIHQAFVDVNEEGTEAAAATGVIVGLSAVTPNIFRADHPFIFIIQERQTGYILFFGKVVDPSK